MANIVTTLFSDSAKTNALYPRTKTSAVSDNDGNSLGNVAVWNALDVASGVDTVKVGVDMDLLWTNSAPTSSFSAQTLNIDMNNYSMILVVATSRTDLDVRFTTLLTVGTYTARLCSTFTGTNVYTTRNVNLTSASLGFEGGYNGSTSNNSYCIPLYIYGVR